MNPRSRRLLASAGLVVFAAGLTAWLAVEAELATPLTPEAAMLPASAVPISRALAPITEFAAIIDRPIFVPSRRPLPKVLPVASVVETKAAAVVVPTLPLALVGVLISPDGRFAVLRSPDGTSRTVAEGATVDGWQLKQVTAERALFNSGLTNTEMKFSAAQTGGKPVVAVGRPIAIRRRQ